MFANSSPSEDREYKIYNATVTDSPAELKSKLEKLNHSLAEWQDALDYSERANEILGGNQLTEELIAENKQRIEKLNAKKEKLEKIIHDSSEEAIMRKIEKEIPGFGEMAELCKKYNEDIIWVEKFNLLLKLERQLKINFLAAEPDAINQVARLKIEIQEHAAEICEAKLQLRKTPLPSLPNVSLSTEKLLQYQTLSKKIKKVTLGFEENDTAEHACDQIALCYLIGNDEEIKRHHEFKSSETFFVDYTNLNKKYPCIWGKNLGLLFQKDHKELLARYHEQPIYKEEPMKADSSGRKKL